MLAALALLAGLAAIDQSKPRAASPKTTRRRPRTSAADVRRLAQLITLVDRRRERRDELAGKVDSLRRGNLMTVVGEQALLTAVDTLLAEAGRLVSELESDGGALGGRIDALEQVLAGYEWEVVEQTLPLLEDKLRKQAEVVLQLQADVDGCRKQLDPLRSELELARSVSAPVPWERTELKRLDGLVLQAERALLDQRYTDVQGPLGELTRSADLDSLIENVRRKRENAERFTRQAEVLLLKAPGELAGTHSYTVLLRTPSERGSHGINIQDSSSLVDQDRAYILGVIKRVTGAVDAGLARSFQPTPAEAPTAPAEAPAAPAENAPAAQAENAPAPQVENAPAAPAENAPESPPADGPREWNPQAESQPGDAAAPRLDDLRTLIGEVGNVMFRLSMPDRMRQYLSTTPCALTVTTNDLELPWELMYDSGWEESPGEAGLGFLCLQRPVARMPMGRAFPRVRRKAVQRKAKLRFLLVYADPDENLPAAGAEVLQIESALKERWSRPGEDLIDIKVLKKDEATGEQMNRALLSGDYDVIHFAGHAHFNDEDPDLSGFLLHGHEICFSQKIQRFVEGNPLVFLNACQTGVTANENAPQSVGEYFWKPAEGLASAFLYGGALGCVGSLWPIYDRPAADFAIEFYNQVLEGQMIGEAMRVTRRANKEKYPESITWASFVLYGDPTFRLVE